MTIPEKAVNWAIGIAQDDAHGYDQTSRWGPNYDCSSFVITAYQKAGVDVRSKGATYTGNMLHVFLSCGFRPVTDGTLRAGDVLLNEKNHAAMYIGAGQLVQASLNEKGTVTGGQSGDQTGKEIAVVPFYQYPWDCVLRYAANSGSEESQDTAVSLPMVKRGDVSGAVLSVQLLLIHKWAVSCGIDGADGDFGPNTESAVKAFQTHKRLEADGIVGPLTWAALIGGTK